MKIKESAAEKEVNLLLAYCAAKGTRVEEWYSKPEPKYGSFFEAVMSGRVYLGFEIQKRLM